MWWIVAALAQDYAFPTSPDDRQYYYPTAYKDHGGTDWNCGSITYGGHQGSDFGAGSFPGMDDGRDVTAAAEGTVIVTHDGEFDRCTTADCPGGYGFGNYVQLAHANGRTTLYGHLKKFSLLVNVGDVVGCGDKLGEMGSSGNSSGPHLHFEVRNTSNVAEDPFDGPCSAPPTYWTDQGVYDEIPGDVCEVAEPCSPEQTLTCGDSVSGSNDEGVSEVWRYGCDDFVYSGPERAFTVVTDRDEPVTVRLEGLTGDLDLVALVSAECAGGDCITSSSSPNEADESLVVDAQAGVAFTVVLDGWEGAVSPFVLSVDCAGGWGEPTTTPGTAGTGATADTGEVSRTTPTESTPTPTGFIPDETVPTLSSDLSKEGGMAGCGCRAALLPATGWVLAVPWLGLRRRERS
jgi:hypothetical protein